MTIRNKVVVITGGARGIGYATAYKLAGLGAKVAIGDIDEAKVKEAGTALGLDVYGKLDVTQADSFEAFLERVELELGPVDVLINNAGIMPVGHFEDEPDGVSKRMIDINVWGVVLGSKLAVKRMLPRGSGHVINISSLAGEVTVPGAATYCGTKWAVLGFTDSLALEYRHTPLEFSSVQPTFTNTELVSGTHGVGPLRNAEPEEIADAIAKLIEHPRRRARVTWAAGMLTVVMMRFVPAPIREFVGERLGVDNALLDDVDSAARKAYEDRVRGGA